MPNQFLSVTDRNLAFALSKRWQVTEDLGISMGPELMPVVSLPVEEMWYHLGWNRYASAGTITALAANFARVRIRMPTAANIICVVESIFFFAAVPLEFTIAEVASGAVDLTSVIGGMPRDTRQVQGKPGTCVVSAQPGGQLPISGVAFGYPANNPQPAPALPLFLIPGQATVAYDFGIQTANQAVDFCITYRERMLNEAESAK